MTWQHFDDRAVIVVEKPVLILGRAGIHIHAGALSLLPDRDLRHVEVYYAPAPLFIGLRFVDHATPFIYAVARRAGGIATVRSQGTRRR